MKKIEGTELFCILFLGFCVFAGFMEKGFTFDKSLLVISGVICGALILKIGVVRLIYQKIQQYEKDDEIISSRWKTKYRLISGLIILTLSVGIISFMFLFRVVSMFVFGISFSWLLIGIMFLFDSDYLLYRFFLKSLKSNGKKGIKKITKWQQWNGYTGTIIHSCEHCDWKSEEDNSPEYKNIIKCPMCGHDLYVSIRFGGPEIIHKISSNRFIITDREGREVHIKSADAPDTILFMMKQYNLNEWPERFFE